MFTELLHVTTQSNFNQIKNNKVILSRKLSNQTSRSMAMPSHENLIYFSCSENHNETYIIAKNVIPDDIIISFADIIFDLVQIKILVNNEQLNQLDFKIIHDEDSFLKPLMNSLTVIENKYHLDTFIVKNEFDELIKNIISFLPHKNFALGSTEYTKNRDCLLYPNSFMLKKLLHCYYEQIPMETCALENRLDLKMLQLNGINSLYRKIQITSKYTKNNKFNSIIFSISNKDKWQSIV